MEGDVEGVFDGGLVAVGADAGSDGGGRVEEKERLIDEVGAEVEEHAVGGVGGLLPGVLARGGAEAVEVRLEGDEAADGGLGEEFFDGKEVTVPTAVVEGDDEQTVLFGEGGELEGLGAGGGEGLVDDDVLAGLERARGESEMRLVGRGDDDEGDGLVGEQIVDIAVDTDGWVGFGSLVARALHDGDEAQSGDGADERRVEDAAAEAVADDSDTDFSCRHFFTSLRSVLKQDTCGGSGRRSSPCWQCPWER